MCFVSTKTTELGQLLTPGLMTNASSPQVSHLAFPWRNWSAIRPAGIWIPDYFGHRPFQHYMNFLKQLLKVQLMIYLFFN